MPCRTYFVFWKKKTKQKTNFSISHYCHTQSQYPVVITSQSDMKKCSSLLLEMWFTFAGRDLSERSLTHSQDALSLPESSTKGDGVSQRENSGDSVSVIPLQGSPHTSAKTQQGAFMRAPSLLFQRYPVTPAPSYEAGLQKAWSGSWDPPEKQTLTGNVTAACHSPAAWISGRVPGTHSVAFKSCWFGCKSFPFSILPEIFVWLGTPQIPN